MWEIEYTDEWESWWQQLSGGDRERVRAAVEILEEVGPALGRPLVDTLQGSRLANLKELRPRGGYLRVLLALRSQTRRDPAAGRRQDRPVGRLVVTSEQGAVPTRTQRESARMGSERWDEL